MSVLSSALTGIYRGPFFDLMIDLETMGVPPCAPVVSIGAAFFSISREEIGPTYHQAINLATAVRDGGVLDCGTIMWWLQQDQEARNAICHSAHDNQVVLREFAAWISQTCRHMDVRPWGNGSSFDLTILGGAYDRIGMKRPWKFNNERDFRTVRNMFPKVVYDVTEKSGQAHNARDDAIFQAQHLFKINRAYGRNVSPDPQ
jgi:hypothetical protein